MTLVVDWTTNIKLQVFHIDMTLAVDWAINIK